MRVTHQMIIDRTISSLSNNITRLMNIERMLATGKQINVPSDNPIGSQHVMNYKTRIGQIQQYQTNITQGISRLSTYESGLADLKNFNDTALEIAISMGNDTFDETARLGAAQEVESLMEQILQIGNMQRDGRYMFSGHETRLKPLIRSANGVEYMGDTGLVDIEVDVNSRIKSNLIGQNVFLKQLSTIGEGADLHTGVVGTTLLADLNMGGGIDLISGANPGEFTITDNNLNSTITINLNNDPAGNPAPPPVDVDEIVNRINGQLGLAGSTLQVTIPDTGARLQWDTTVPATNSITADTPLANLNGGRGVDISSGEFRVRDATSTTVLDIDISSAETVDDVITTVQAALDATFGAGVVTFGLNADNNGFAFDDTTGGTLDLLVEEMPGLDSTTASDLGIVGTIDPLLTGRDLEPQPDFDVADIGLQTTIADLGLDGEVRADRMGDDIIPQLTGTTLLSTLNAKAGFNMGSIKISQGSLTRTLDLSDSALPPNPTINDLINAINTTGLDITASINEAGTGIQIVSDDPTRTLIVENVDTNDRTASMLGIIGAPDVLSTMMLLETSLRNNDSELARQLVGNLEDNIQHLLSVRAEVGTRVIRLETTQYRHEETEINLKKLLSEVEDADITTLVAELANQENLYQASLLASSKVIQPSLLDFLR